MIKVCLITFIPEKDTSFHSKTGIVRLFIKKIEIAENDKRMRVVHPVIAVQHRIELTC